MIYYYICAIFTLISSIVSFGFSIEAYIKSKNSKENDLSTAKYAVSRSLSLFIISIGLLIFNSNSYLIAMAAIMIGVQLFDGIIGIKISTFKTVGPILTAITNAALLVLFIIKAI